MSTNGAIVQPLQPRQLSDGSYLAFGILSSAFSNKAVADEEDEPPPPCQAASSQELPRHPHHEDDEDHQAFDHDELDHLPF